MKNNLYLRTLAMWFVTLTVGMISIPVQAEVEFSYYVNTFINYGNCLGIYPDAPLNRNENVWMFSLDSPPTFAKVDHVINALEAQEKFKALGFDKVYQDKLLWKEIGCAHPFRGDIESLLALAQVIPRLEGLQEIGVAIRGLPKGAWISQGKEDFVSMNVQDNPYVKVVRHLVTNACYGSDALIRVKRFPIREGRAIVQLDVGKATKLSAEKRIQMIEEEAQLMTGEWGATYKKRELEKLGSKSYFESVQICRFLVDGERVLSTRYIPRKTGVDERVDTPTELDAENWADTTDNAIGFISLNAGKDWDAIFVDVGWEGINYSIERLNNSTELFNRSLYTFH